MSTTTTPETEPEALTPEVVDQPTAAEEVDDSAERANEAIVRAADAALTMPGIPGKDEFLSLAMQARVLSMSGAAPKEVQNNPHLAFHIAMVGRDLGISPSAALELIDVIPGRGTKPPQLSLSPQLINGQIRRLGLGSIVPVIKSATKCVAVAMGPDGFYDPRCKPEWPDHHERCECTIRAFLGETEFTWEDARMAGLVAMGCEPGQHTSGCKGDGRSCNQGYITYPKRMLWWRASGFLADDIFPEASLGMYTPEALGAIVDAEGRPVDPATVELPAGYEPAELPPPPPPKETGPAAAADVLDDLRVRVAALPDVQRATYREKWLESQRLRGFTLDNLPEDRLTLATSMLKGFETIAAREGWDAEAARAAVLAARDESPGDPEEGPQDAESAPEPPDGGKDQGGAGEATGGDPGADGAQPEASSAVPGDEAAKEAIAAAVRDIADLARHVMGSVPAETATRITDEVNQMHWTKVNAALTEAQEEGFEPLPFDARKMMLATIRVYEEIEAAGQ